EVFKPPLESAGEIPSAIDVPNGCRFHNRCPLATPACGWEGRDVATALADWDLALKPREALGKPVVEGLNVRIPAPQGEAAGVALLDQVMAAKHPSLVTAPKRSFDGGALVLAFEALPSPSRRVIGPGHEVACVLY
ncbi:MAG: hypothetical protein ACK4GT_16655, partial [Pararhodobacter sp.]